MNGLCRVPDSAFAYTNWWCFGAQLKILLAAVLLMMLAAAAAGAPLDGSVITMWDAAARPTPSLASWA
jgi:hypothetical protein